MNVTSTVLLKGAWYAIEQSGNLLRDAILLYRANAYSSAIALAMAGREELGKHRMLLEEWRKSQETGILPDVEAIQAVSVSHIKKQRRSSLSLRFTPEQGSSVDAACRTILQHTAEDAEYQEALKVIEAAFKDLAKRVADIRHTARMHALYVDLQDSGEDWDRPVDVTQGECQKLISDAAQDYSGQWHWLSIDRLRTMGEPRLAQVLEHWDQRPDLPPPVWPE